MNKPKWLKYHFELITGSIKWIVNVKQNDNKNILYYLKRPKQAKYILEAHISKYILRHYEENLEEFKNVTEASQYFYKEPSVEVNLCVQKP